MTDEVSVCIGNTSKTTTLYTVMEETKPSRRIRCPRQDPVSCQFCRSKKLKCDRQHPCSNCSARGVTCQPVVRHKPQTPRGDQQQPPIPENVAILARLKKLEDKVSAMGNVSFLSGQSPQQPSPTTSISRTPLSTSTTRTIVDEDYRTASELLENVGASYISNVSDDSHGISLKIEPVNRWAVEPYVRRTGHSASIGTILLPTKTEAVSLLKYYMDNIHYLHPVIDALAVRRMLETVYTCPELRIYREPAHIALLLSIFASTGYLWSSHENDELYVFSSPKVANLASSAWSDAALDVADYSRRTSSGSIENIQATIIIEYLIYNNNGFSATCRLLHSNTITMARDLSLHRIDIPHRRQKTNSEADMAEDETKRRIWWYVASTDWLLAFSGGPQEGTYLIHPAHMHVRYPQIVSGDLAQSDQSNGSESTPTSMSYFLQRIRLSEICRTIVDSIPRFLGDIDMVDYDKIIALDDQFEDLTKSFPVFFHLDEESRLMSRGTDHKFPHIATQRYLIHLGVLNRRCKLHQPYLIRGFVEPKYAFSRDVCLRSARNALEVNRVLEKTKSDLGCAPARFGTVVHHVFMATVVLVMDLCFNKIESQEEQRQAEVMRACRMLQEAKQDSVLSKMFLDPLMDILQNHRALVLSDQKSLSFTPSGARHSHVSQHRKAHEPPNRISQRPLHFPTATGANQCTDSTTPMAPPANPSGQQYDMTQAYDHTGIDEIMQNYIDIGPNMDIPRWNDLFADLDSHQAMDGSDFFYE
ncbi:hypothetical protein V492_01183 [Pseudogymnoascus sp. VKM F-4246]|nr:hypothetical protein V492_01183 [Pseudogymnoascus sp. VKM F-4246]